VHVAPSFGGGSEPACQISHPSGVVIECSSLPPAAWVTALLSGASDVPASASASSSIGTPDPSLVFSLVTSRRRPLRSTRTEPRSVL
jgi:hypothetical protein